MAVIQSEGRLANVQAGWAMSSSYGSLNLYGAYTEDYASIFRTQHNVRTVVSFLARNIASLGLKTYRRVADDEREQLADHQIARTIRQPNPWTTRYRWLESMVTDLATFDLHCSVKVNGPEGQVRLLRVPPQNVEPLSKNWFRAERYRLFGANELTFPAEQVIFMHGHNPDDPKTGLSPLETLRRVLAEEAASGEYREWMWRNKARVEGVLSTDKRLSDEAVARLRAQWKALYAGAKGSGETAILEEGLDFKEITMSSKDAQYLETRKLSREEVASAYHVQPAMVGILEHANFANMSEQHKMLYQDTLGPWLVMIEEELEMQLLPEFSDTDNVYLEFNINEKLKGSFEEQVRAGQASVGAPWVTRNEMRARMNLPPVENGDGLVTPLNVLIGGQASPLDADPDQPNNGPAALPETTGQPLADDVAKLVAAATALVRAGYDPAESLQAVGLDPIEHLGLLPITLQGEEEAKALADYFGKVRDVVLTQLGYKKDATADRLFDAARWTSELWNLLGETEHALEKADEITADVLERLTIALASNKPKQAVKEMFDQLIEETR